MAEGKEKGWISVYRKIEDGWLWKEKPFSKGQAWIDLLIMANHQNNKFLLGNEIMNVKRGELITSIRKLGERWGWSRCKTKTFLDLLERDLMIVKKSDSKKTTLSIVNYSDYQDLKDSEKATNKPRLGHEKAALKPRNDTNNNDNNVNNENNDNNDNKYKENFTTNPLLKSTLLDFVDMRKRIKAPMTDKAIKILVNKLKGLSADEEMQIKILEQSIMNGWKSIYPLKEEPVIVDKNKPGYISGNNINVKRGIELLKKYEKEEAEGTEGGKSVWDV